MENIVTDAGEQLKKFRRIVHFAKIACVHYSSPSRLWN